MGTDAFRVFDDEFAASLGFLQVDLNRRSGTRLAIARFVVDVVVRHLGILRVGSIFGRNDWRIFFDRADVEAEFVAEEVFAFGTGPFGRRIATIEARACSFWFVERFVFVTYAVVCGNVAIFRFACQRRRVGAQRVDGFADALTDETEHRTEVRVTAGIACFANHFCRV